jgi:hypothetical protein
MLERHESIAKHPARMECRWFSLSKLANKYYSSYDRSLKTPESLAFVSSAAWNLVIREDIFSIAVTSIDLKALGFEKS